MRGQQIRATVLECNFCKSLHTVKGCILLDVPAVQIEHLAKAVEMAGSDARALRAHLMTIFGIAEADVRGAPARSPVSWIRPIQCSLFRGAVNMAARSGDGEALVESVIVSFAALVADEELVAEVGRLDGLQDAVHTLEQVGSAGAPISYTHDECFAVTLQYEQSPLMQCKISIRYSCKCITNFLSMRNKICNADLPLEECVTAITTILLQCIPLDLEEFCPTSSHCKFVDYSLVQVALSVSDVQLDRAELVSLIDGGGVGTHLMLGEASKAGLEYWKGVFATENLSPNTDRMKVCVGADKQRDCSMLSYNPVQCLIYGCNFEGNATESSPLAGTCSGGAIETVASLGNLVANPGDAIGGGGDGEKEEEEEKTESSGGFLGCC
ncbi:unnamed protein product [Amoebophrya sp. A120]|nr:unnamed protein product [Amoebophrya sp. A120]|eukprot:GSA120T00014219001.1